jgi:hypothetical protein
VLVGVSLTVGYVVGWWVPCGLRNKFLCDAHVCVCVVCGVVCVCELRVCVCGLYRHTLILFSPSLLS